DDLADLVTGIVAGEIDRPEPEKARLARELARQPTVARRNRIGQLLRERRKANRLLDAARVEQLEQAIDGCVGIDGSWENVGVVGEDAQAHGIARIRPTPNTESNCRHSPKGRESQADDRCSYRHPAPCPGP